MLQRLGIELRVQLRSRMALAYGFLFPTVFLVAFRVLYRFETPPITRHLGELLTVTALGGACFALPIALVNERERGVWRRYRLTPASSGQLVLSTLAVRYLLLLAAFAVQLLLAMLIGMPLPAHPLELWLACTLVSFAMLGLGLMIATLADTVPAAQALGQSVFLPMLMIGGIAVRLEALPGWAQSLSAFFPGRYAVEAIQSTVTGEGLGSARMPVMALLMIGGAAMLAGLRTFRWDSHQPFALRSTAPWLAVALGGWIAVGLLAESTGHLQTHSQASVALRNGSNPDSVVATGRATTGPPGSAEVLTPGVDPLAGGVGRDASGADRDQGSNAAASRETDRETESLDDPGATVVSPRDAVVATPPSRNDRAVAGFPGDADAEAAAASPADADTTQGRSAPLTPPAAAPAPLAPTGQQAPWQRVTMAEIDAGLDFTNLPPDVGVVAPIAVGGYVPSAETECMRSEFPFWEPGNVADPVQRVRNYLYVAAVPDLLQMDRIESMVPILVLERLRQAFDGEELIRILYWISTHPDEGDVDAASALRPLCIDADSPGDPREIRERSVLYAMKFAGRLMGRIHAR